MRFETLLTDEIENELKELKDMKLGSDEYKATVDGLTKLIDRSIAINKFENELEEQIESREKDNEIKLKQLEEERMDMYIRNGVAIAGLIIQSAITIWGTKASFEFEKEGTITTIMGRGFINKLLPKK